MSTRSIATRSEPPDPALRYRGWVQVGTAARIRRRGSITVRRFGRDVVVTCDRAGEFHAADEAQRDRAVPLAEAGGVVFMYRWAPGDDRSSPPPAIDDFIGDVLSDPRTFRSSFRYQIHSSLPTLVENAVDRAHFPAVHQRHCDWAGPYEIEVRDTGSFWAKTELWATIPPGFQRKGTMEVEFCDPFNSRVRSPLLGRLYDLVVLTAPMGDSEVDILFIALSPRWFPLLDRAIHYGMLVNQRLVVDDDRNVLATRTISPRPVLSEVDGPIMAIRHWLSGYRSDGPEGAVIDEPTAVGASC